MMAETPAAVVNNRHYFDDGVKFNAAVAAAVRATDTVVDVGCGIMPMSFFWPKFHILIEPYHEYSDILAHRYATVKNVFILRGLALETLRLLADKSVDSIFMLDVIEHIEKDEGRLIIAEMERVAREQIVIFTPLGFMEQHADTDGKDGWGLSGMSFQEHRSGWTPDDFTADWEFYVCENFHNVDYKGDPLAVPHGAFYAIRTMEPVIIAAPLVTSEVRPVSPEERELIALQHLHNEVQRQYFIEQGLRMTREQQLDELEGRYNVLLTQHSLSHWLIQQLKKIFGTARK